MYEGRERWGCHAGCGCTWYEQCYPKFVMVKGDQSKTVKSKVNVGVCDLAMPVLAIASVLLFVVLIGLVVSARMYLTKDPPPMESRMPAFNEAKARSTMHEPTYDTDTIQASDESPAAAGTGAAPTTEEREDPHS
eukprot:symbB.v1.2.000856.t1/scaffold37.1/size397765/28